MENNIITYEQAVSLKKFDEVASTYQEMAMTMMRYFQSNTLAQITHCNFYYDLMDITTAYFKKDYSSYLFQQTERKYEEFNKIVESNRKSSELLAQLSGLYTKLILEEKQK